MIGGGGRSYAKCLFHEDLPEIQQALDSEGYRIAFSSSDYRGLKVRTLFRCLRERHRRMGGIAGSFVGPDRFSAELMIVVAEFVATGASLRTQPVRHVQSG